MRTLRRAFRRAYSKVLFSHGDRYHCVFCGKSYSRFLRSGSDRSVYRRHNVAGAGRRFNARCANCFSNDRARMLYLFFKNRTPVFDEAAKILHVAPDYELATSLHASPNVTLFAGGLTVGGLRPFRGTKFDVTFLPFADEQFDIVVCNHVMQYVPDDRKGFREMFRVLKPGGFAIIQVALALDFAETYEAAGLEINRANTIKHYGHSYNVRLYGLDYVDRIEDAGFVAEKHNIFTERWVPDPERHGLDPREDVYVFRKPAR